MQVFPHFHWISIQGIRPNIPENFIREEFKISENKNDNLMAGDTNINKQQIQYINSNNGHSSKDIKGHKVVPPVIHNIPKELQIFLENFEQRFRKEIKITKINPYPLYSMTHELQISLNVIENEPGVVELLPYILEFLMNTLANNQYIKDPRVHLLILHYIKSILKNQYFFLEPYLHQIVTLVLSLILMENSDSEIDAVITTKDYAISLLKIIFAKYEIKYPNFINQLLNLLKNNLMPDTKNPNFMTTYGAIKSINILGPSYIIDLILPKIDFILNATYDTGVINLLDKTKTGFSKVNDSMSINSIQNSQNIMIIEQPDNVEMPYQAESFPKISFSLPQFIQNNPLSSSIFSVNSNLGNVKTDQVVFGQEIKKEKLEKIPVISKNQKLPLSKIKKAFYVYYALKVILNIYLLRILQLFYSIIFLTWI